MAAGDFSPSQLVQAQIQADKMWADGSRKADYEGRVEVVKALRGESTADVRILEDGEKDRDVKVHWIDMCTHAIEDYDDDDCDAAGTEPETSSKTYALGNHKQFKYTVDENKLRTNDYNMENVVAAGLLKADKMLSEGIAAVAVAKLEAFKGTNAVTTGVGTWDVANTQTNISPADWNAALFAYLYRVGITNEMAAPFLVSGSNLFEERILAMMNKANGEGKGDANLHGMMRTYFDLFNVDAANAPDFKSYMVNRGAVAFAHKNYYRANPKTYLGAGQQRYSIPSRNLPGVRFDVIYTNRCSGTTILHDFKFTSKFDFFNNPTGCDSGKTGVLAFKNV